MCKIINSSAKYEDQFSFLSFENFPSDMGLQQRNLSVNALVH